jgi:hypothetical protein
MTLQICLKPKCTGTRAHARTELDRDWERVDRARRHERYDFFDIPRFVGALCLVLPVAGRSVLGVTTSAYQCIQQTGRAVGLMPA